ncbi:unnamed protein product [Owenia fusiformis]|uniref:Uncharacterized protein n=1 Tax=Owenia fusiformis TaxID=6347 RepID=A0A8J1TSJ6_OWEFU|nr:unnamed protein product [Owenia fusiformis]
MDEWMSGWQKPGWEQDYQYAISIITVVLCFIGIFGNIALFCFAFSLRVRLYSFSIYLALLAAANILVVIMEGLDDFLEVLIPWDWLLFRDNVWGCKFYELFFKFGKLVASWSVVAMCIDDYIYNCHVSRRDDLCSKRNSEPVVFVIIFASFLLSVPYLVIRDVGNGTLPARCQIKHPDGNAIFDVIIVEMLLIFIIPVILSGLFTMRTMTYVKNAEDVDNSSRKWDKLTASVLAISLLFMIALTPSGILTTIIRIMEHGFKETYATFYTESPIIRAIHLAFRTWRLIFYALPWAPYLCIMYRDECCCRKKYKPSEDKFYRSEVRPYIISNPPTLNRQLDQPDGLDFGSRTMTNPLHIPRATVSNTSTLQATYNSIQTPNHPSSPPSYKPIPAKRETTAIQTKTKSNKTKKKDGVPTFPADDQSDPDPDTNPYSNDNGWTETSDFDWQYNTRHYKLDTRNKYPDVWVFSTQPSPIAPGGKPGGMAPNAKRERNGMFRKQWVNLEQSELSNV